jgi:hypothetical protein
MTPAQFGDAMVDMYVRAPFNLVPAIASQVWNGYEGLGRWALTGSPDVGTLDLRPFEYSNRTSGELGEFGFGFALPGTYGAVRSGVASRVGSMAPDVRSNPFLAEQALSRGNSIRIPPRVLSKGAPFGNVAGDGTVLGGRGPATAWNGFDETLAGGPVRDFTTDGVRVSQRGIDVVERHVSRFGADEANSVMIGRLRQIEAGDIAPTTQDLNFYTHELREFVRYRRLGWEEGLPNSADQARQLWLQAHSASLADYNLPLRSESLLYHPDALKVMGW